MFGGGGGRSVNKGAHEMKTGKATEDGEDLTFYLQSRKVFQDARRLIGRAAAPYREAIAPMQPGFQ